MQKKKKLSAASMIFYTFGTILLMTVITICTVNFLRDGRAFVKTAAVVSPAPDGESADKTGGQENAAGKGNKQNGSKEQAKSGSSDKPGTAPATDPSKTGNAKDPAGNKSPDGNLSEKPGSGAGKPINPGEEP